MLRYKCGHKLPVEYWGKKECPYCDNMKHYPEHIASPYCWCEPEMENRDEETGNEVWVHKESH